MALCPGGRWPALPHPRLLSKSRHRCRHRFCALGRWAHLAKRSPPAHLAKVGHHKSDVRHHCFGGLSSRVHGSGQPRRRWAGSTADLPAAYARASSAAEGCAPICQPRHVRRAVRDSGCTIGGAVPEIGRPAAQISESVVSPPGLALQFGGLLWAARSAVACPGCLWGGAAWHGACFFFCVCSLCM